MFGGIRVDYQASEDIFIFTIDRDGAGLSSKERRVPLAEEAL